MGDVSRSDALAELESAREALGDARLLPEGGGSDAGVCNRLYYAVFHAALTYDDDHPDEMAAVGIDAPTSLSTSLDAR